VEGGPLHVTSQFGYNTLLKVAADSGMDIDARGLLVTMHGFQYGVYDSNVVLFREAALRCI
jgi:hypothetical protein